MLVEVIPFLHAIAITIAQHAHANMIVPTTLVAYASTALLCAIVFAGMRRGLVSGLQVIPSWLILE